jgi:REP element-mobilizing transposase RayT
MPRKLRYTPEGGALYEITCRTIHSRFLFRPTRRLNEIIVGTLARAKRRYGVEISAFCCLSNHFLCAAAHKKCYAEWSVMWS